MPARRVACLIACLSVPAVVGGAAAPVAEVNGAAIAERELTRPLIDAHGLEMLLALAQLKAAQQEVRAAGLEVTDADVKRERQMTLDLFADNLTLEGQDRGDVDPEQLLTQFLAQQQIPESRFDLTVRTNAHLRKLVGQGVDEQITPEVLERAFNQKYGERARVRHIAVPNLELAEEARQKVNAGRSFADVAREMSTQTRTAANGGEVPPFSRQQTGLPASFRQVAFALTEPGQISDPVQADGSYHLIQLVEKLPPRLVKLEDVREELRRELADGFAAALMNQKRGELQTKVRDTIRINDPELRRQFEAELAKVEPQPIDRAELDRRLRERREED